MEEEEEEEEELAGWLACSNQPGSYQKISLIGSVWDTNREPVPLAQILHCMPDHSSRYSHFIRCVYVIAQYWDIGYEGSLCDLPAMDSIFA